MSEMSRGAESLWRFLNDWAVGRKKAVRAKIIAKGLGTSWREVMRWKAELLAAGYRC